jgi:IMP dehydrogenase
MSNILASDVMIRDIYTIKPKNKIALARLRMLRKGVGALPVVDDKNILVGIITLRDTDFVRVYDISVEDMMTTEVITKSENSTISEIVDIMLEKHVERLPIVNEEVKLIGLITQSVILRVTKRLLDKEKDEKNN